MKAVFWVIVIILLVGGGTALGMWIKHKNDKKKTDVTHGKYVPPGPKIIHGKFVPPGDRLVPIIPSKDAFARLEQVNPKDMKAGELYTLWFMTGGTDQVANSRAIVASRGTQAGSDGDTVMYMRTLDDILAMSPPSGTPDTSPSTAWAAAFQIDAAPAVDDSGAITFTPRWIAYPGGGRNTNSMDAKGPSSNSWVYGVTPPGGNSVTLTELDPYWANAKLYVATAGPYALQFMPIEGLIQYELKTDPFTADIFKKNPVLGGWMIAKAQLTK